VSDKATSARSDLLATVLGKLWMFIDACIGAMVYEQQVGIEGLKNEALWIRRIVTGSLYSMVIIILQFIFSIISHQSLDALFDTSVYTIRALLTVAILLNDLMRLPRALQVAPPPPASSSTASAIDKVRERTSRRLAESTGVTPSKQ
jgi:hypothetical protein